MHPYCPALPGMKAIANFTYIPNMGIALLSCIIMSALTRAKEITCSSPPPFRLDHQLLFASYVTSASAVCSSSINAPHDYFDSTRTNAFLAQMF